MRLQINIVCILLSVALVGCASGRGHVSSSIPGVAEYLAVQNSLGAPCPPGTGEYEVGVDVELVSYGDKLLDPQVYTAEPMRKCRPAK